MNREELQLIRLLELHRIRKRHYSVINEIKNVAKLYEKKGVSNFSLLNK